MGKRVDEMKPQEIKLMMDNNFISYVHLIMLFLKQKQLSSATKHRFQIVNVNSIAGHTACSRNSAYCASKYALNGFMDALRQELLYKPQIVLTNFYPWYINTGLFEGFKPLLAYVLPTLDQNYVVNRMYEAILAEEEEVYIQSFIFWFKVLTAILPLTVKNLAYQILVGQGMDSFKGRRISKPTE